MADDPSAALEKIRARGYRNGAHGAECGRLSDAAAEDVPCLLAAVEAVIGKAAEWEQEAAKAGPQAKKAYDRGDDEESLLLSGHAAALEDCAGELRETLRAALAGKEAGGGH